MSNYTRGSLAILSLGTTLFLAAAVHHTREFYALGELLGPFLAFLLDGLPALGIVYGGWYLARTDLNAPDHDTVGAWCVAGSVLFVSVIGATLLVRAFEGRPLGEPEFSILVAAEIGALAGFVAGYYNVRAAVDARQARRATGGLRVVNGILRHDLRNDLTAIRTYGELIETETDSGEHAAKIVGKADDAIERIEDVGALEPIDLVAVVTAVTARAEEVYDRQIRTDLPESAVVSANAAIRSVADNLVENAIEHTDADDPRITVEVETDAETVRLLVGDNGPGIPDDQKATVFEYREDGTGGGGLFLVGTLVEEYGGDVWIEDNDPRGTTFVVELPRADSRSGRSAQG